MVNEEILGGLKAAIGRGESIEQARLTFANAGYSQNEIEEAISAIQSEGKAQANPAVQNFEDKKPEQKVSEPENKKIEEPKSNPEKTEQKVSKYGDDQNPKNRNPMIILLISILTILLGGLASMFIFKDQVMTLLSTIFD